MTNIKRLLSMLAVVALVGCGDDENAGTPPFGSPPPPAGTTVTNLTLNLSATSVNNSGSETVTATVTATNENNQTLTGAAIVLKVDNEAEIAVNGTETDATGQLTGTVRIGDNHQNRTITVTALANNGTLQKAKTFQVVGANLTGTLVPAVLTTGAPGVVKYRLVDSNSNPMTGVALAVTGPGGAVTNATTGANGDYDYGYTAPATAGDLAIHAAAAGDTLDLTVLVTTTGGGSIPPVNPAVSPVRSASVSANPTVVPVNIAAGTTNQAQIRALFLTDQNAPVRNIRVRFDLAGDVNSIGGTFGTGTNIVYSDANGVATTSYIAGTRSSPTDGLTVRACWDYVDFTGTCPNAVTTTLTVTADPVSITIGTDNKVDPTGAGGLAYIKKYVVQVVDSSGLAKPDVQITPAVDLLQYLKGEWVPGAPWTKVERAGCDNEDINRNNTNEVYSNGQAEDANHSFNLTPGRPALEPRKADVSVSVVGSSRTDSTGVVVIQLQYPKNLGSWVNFNLQVSAGGVSATEGRANFEGLLPVLADDIKDINVEPPFRYSPYGIQTSATVLVTDPQSGKTGNLCINPN